MSVNRSVRFSCDKKASERGAGMADANQSGRGGGGGLRDAQPVVDMVVMAKRTEAK